MSKEKAEGTATTNARVPAGYQRQSSDIVGFWDPETSGPIHFIPRHVKLFDSKIEPTKSSTLLTGELVDACKVVDASSNVIEARKGELVGIWTKPGMRDLQNLAGVAVYMYQDGEKDIGKPSPMKMFSIFSKERGGKLFVSEDLRDKSATVRTTTGGNGTPAPASNPQVPAAPQQDIPF
jgi:hypothetical protein